MPHAGLMDEAMLGPINGPLMRARLHLRGGRRRLRQGKISAGIATLYDALESAMEAYIAVPEHKALLNMGAGDDLTNSGILFALLVRSRAISGSLDFAAFDALLVRALDREIPGYDYRDLLHAVEQTLTELEVLPFDEASLLPEDPSTY